MITQLNEPPTTPPTTPPSTPIPRRRSASRGRRWGFRRRLRVRRCEGSATGGGSRRRCMRTITTTPTRRKGSARGTTAAVGLARRERREHSANRTRLSRRRCLPRRPREEGERRWPGRLARTTSRDQRRRLKQRPRWKRMRMPTQGCLRSVGSPLSYKQSVTHRCRRDTHA